MKEQYELIWKRNENEKEKIVSEARERVFQESLDQVWVVNNKAKEIEAQIQREIQIIEKAQGLEDIY